MFKCNSNEYVMLEGSPEIVIDSSFTLDQRRGSDNSGNQLEQGYENQKEVGNRVIWCPFN